MTQDDTERGRGVLSGSDREYLRDPDEFTRQARYRRRDAIPERVWNAFLDGRVLFNELNAEQRREIFRGWEDFADRVEAEGDDEGLTGKYYDVAESRGEWVERIAAERGFAGWFAFLYVGLSDSEKFEFADILETAVQRAERSRGREVSTFTFEVESQPNPSIDELRERFEQRDELTASEISRLREAGEVDDEQLAAYYDEYSDFSPDTV